MFCTCLFRINILRFIFYFFCSHLEGALHPHMKEGLTGHALDPAPIHLVSPLHNSASVTWWNLTGFAACLLSLIIGLVYRSLLMLLLNPSSSEAVERSFECNDGIHYGSYFFCKLMSGKCKQLLSGDSNPVILLCVLNFKCTGSVKHKLYWCFDLRLFF